jgi:hypothetical protein
LYWLLLWLSYGRCPLIAVLWLLFWDIIYDLCRRADCMFCNCFPVILCRSPTIREGFRQSEQLLGFTYTDNKPANADCMIVLHLFEKYYFISMYNFPWIVRNCKHTVLYLSETITIGTGNFLYQKGKFLL